MEIGGHGGQKPQIYRWAKGMPKWMRPAVSSAVADTSTVPSTSDESSPAPDLGVLRQCAEALRAMPSPAHQQLAESLTALADEQRTAK